MIKILNVYIKDKNHRTADWCHCCNCWSDLLIDVGTDKCPMCKGVGTMMSANDGTPVELSDIKDKYDEVRTII